MSQLETMFPNMSRALLEEALNFSNGDYESALDHIMQQQASSDKSLQLIILFRFVVIDNNFVCLKILPTHSFTVTQFHKAPFLVNN